MATIGLEIPSALVSTNVENDVPPFDNGQYQTFPSGTQFPEGDSLYENTGDDIITAIYDVATEPTYILNQVVYKDTLIQKVTDLTDTIPEQPEDYSTSVDTSFDQTTWTKRYMKVEEADFAGGLIGPNVAFETEFSSIKGVDFSPDGLSMYVLDRNLKRVNCYTMSSAHDIPSATLTSTTPIVATSDREMLGLTIGNNGTRMYIRTADTRPNHGAIQYTITSGTLVGAAYNGYTAFTSSSFYSTSLNMKFSDDGLTLFVVGNSGFYPGSYAGYIEQYALDTAWDILGTRTKQTGFAPANTYYSDWMQIEFGLSGLTMYVRETNSTYGDTGETRNMLIKYSLSSPWDLVSVPSEIGRIDLGITDYISPVLIDGDNTLITGFGSTIKKRELETAGDLFTLLTDEYSINQVNGSYNFTSNVDGISLTYEGMEVYNILTNDIYEPTAYTTSNTGFLARTLIINDTGWYIRTSVDAVIEYIDLGSAIVTYTPIIYVADIPNFARISATNPYKPFDGTNITPASSPTPMEYTIEGLEEFNSFTLAKVLAGSLTYTFSKDDGDIVKTETVDIDCKRDENGLLSLYPTTVIFYADEQMPAGSKITISLTHTDIIYLGDFTINNSVQAGFTDINFSHSIQDYNDYTPDPWGQIPEGIKAKVTKFDITADIRLENYDHAVSFNESIAGKFVTIDGSDSNGVVANSLTIFNSLIRRVLLKSISSKTVVSDGDIWLMANTKMSAQEIV